MRSDSGSIWNRTTIITFKRLDMKYREYIQIVINWANPYMWASHYSEVIMSAMVSQITGISIVYSTVCSGVDQRKHQSSMSLAFVRGIHQWLVNSPHKGPVTWKMFPFDDNIMEHAGFNSSKKNQGAHRATCWEKSGCPNEESGCPFCWALLLTIKYMMILGPEMNWNINGQYWK